MAIIPLFCYTNIDIAILSALVLIQNLYIAWYVIERTEFAENYMDEDYDSDDDSIRDYN